MKMNMNKEIQKYKGHIYFFDRVEHDIKPAEWIDCIEDYNHQNYQLHHVVPYTDWEKNTKNVQAKTEHNALILLPKVMHEHLENPMYRLSKEKFEQIYSIHPDLILYDVNSRLPRERELFFNLNLYLQAENLDKNKLYVTETEKKLRKPACKLSLNDITEEDLECF